jgi:MoxR-like ATPase
MDAAESRRAREVAGAQKGAVVTQDRLADVLNDVPAMVQAVHAEMEKCIVGQEATVEAALYALLSRGHCLIEGVPGLGKTLLVRALARVLELSFK